MSEAQTLKTMIHELTHSRLHDVNVKEEAENFDRKSAEVQAESVAFVVSNYFGLDTSEYSFGYVAGWSSGKEFKELNESLGIIKNEADKIISEMEEAIEKELAKEQNIEEIKADTSEEKQTYPYVEIEWSEGGYFKEGEILTLSEANKRFETYEKEVKNLKNEYAAKGDYYPYFKTKLHLHIKENEDHVMRFDIGDGDKNLKEFVGKEMKIYFNKDELDKLFTQPSEKQQDKILSLDDKIKMAEEKCKQNTRSKKAQNKDKEYEK